MQRRCPDKPIPKPVLSATLEYRELVDVEISLNRKDAENLMDFLVRVVCQFKN